MPSPFLTHAVDRLFARLTAVYGREFTGKFDGTTPDAVKAAWAHELRWFTHRLDAVAWALDNLPDKCPNAAQFRNLVRQAPSTEVAGMLPNEAPVRVANAQERAALMRMAEDIRKGEFFAKPGREWAYRLIERHENGDPRPPMCVAMARRAIEVDHGRRKFDE